MSRFAIVADGRCCGFVLRRRHEFESFDADEKSLGLFQTEDGAVTAISQSLATIKSTNQ
jgi:hypothetical protein